MGPNANKANSHLSLWLGSKKQQKLGCNGPFASLGTSTSALANDRYAPAPLHLSTPEYPSFLPFMNISSPCLPSFFPAALYLLPSNLPHSPATSLLPPRLPALMATFPYPLSAHLHDLKRCGIVANPIKSPSEIPSQLLQRKSKVRPVPLKESAWPVKMFVS